MIALLRHYKLQEAIFLACVAIGVAACNGGGDANDDGVAAAQARIDSATLKVAVMPTIDCLPIYVAQHSGLFESESLMVSLVAYTAQMDCDTAIAGGTVQAMATDLVRGERLISQGTPLRYVAATDLQWQLLTGKKARIKQLKQLDDKMVAMTRYSATDMLADRLVDSAGVESERVFRIQVNDVGVRLNMLLTGVMDAMLLPEPQATVARLLPANMVFDSAADTLRMGVIAFSETALSDTLRRWQMEAFLRAYDAACDSIAHYGPAHYGDVISQWCGVDTYIADSMARQRSIEFPHAKPPRQGDIARAREWLRLKLKKEKLKTEE